jgi:transposase
VLLYAYCVGVFSSRRIARGPHEDVALRVIAGDAHPHFTRINQFRLEHRAALAGLFLQVVLRPRLSSYVWSASGPWSR